MPKYTFKGDSPRSLPEYGIDHVDPGGTVEIVQQLDHPDFQLIPEKPTAKAPVTPAPAPSQSPKEEK